MARQWVKWMRAEGSENMQQLRVWARGVNVPWRLSDMPTIYLVRGRSSPLLTQKDRSATRPLVSDSGQRCDDAS